MIKETSHLLVVDDDNKIRDLTKQYLEENNFLVTTAKDAIDAKKKIEIIKFDLLILIILNSINIVKDGKIQNRMEMSEA